MNVFEYFYNLSKKKSEYPIKDLKEYSSGLIAATTTSKKWGDSFILMCKSKEQIPYAKKCLEYLDNIPCDVEKRLRIYLVRYYKDYEQFLDDDQKAAIGPVNEATVLDLIRVESVIVNDKCRQDRIEFHIEGSCKWEIEHGLEVTISDDRILYVGEFEDYGPNSNRLQYIIDKYGFYNPEIDMNVNYADKVEVDEYVGTIVINNSKNIVWTLRVTDKKSVIENYEKLKEMLQPALDDVMSGTEEFIIMDPDRVVNEYTFMQLAKDENEGYFHLEVGLNEKDSEGFTKILCKDMLTDIECRDFFITFFSDGRVNTEGMYQLEYK